MTNPILIASNQIDQLFTEGKILEAFIAIYTEATGPYIFPALVLLTLFGVAYIRTQSIIPIALLTMLLFSTLIYTIPTPAIRLALLIMALAIGSIFFLVFIGRQTR